MDKLYNNAIKGEVAEGFSVDDVRNNFIVQFQKDAHVIDRLFSGTACTLGKTAAE